MIADGYRHGLGLLPGVAIDQHFSQRNRFRELEACLAAYPAICGIGIDEQTAVVVTAQINARYRQRFSLALSELRCERIHEA